MPKRKTADWVRLRAAYEQGDETVAQLALQFGVSTSAIYRRAKSGGWCRQHSGTEDIGQSSLIPRLYHSIDRKLAQLEARMDDDEKLTIADHERETRAIGQLIRNFEKLNDIEGTDEPIKRQPSPQSSSVEKTSGDNDAERIRLELAERILRLRGPQSPAS